MGRENKLHAIQHFITQPDAAWFKEKSSHDRGESE